MRPGFVRRVPRYPERFLPTSPREPRLTRRQAVRPARFVVGLEDCKEFLPERVWQLVRHAPQRVAIYLGRVEEVTPSGELTLTVWEAPSGREAVTTLMGGELEFVGAPPEAPPRPGDVLRIWTWIELQAGGAKERRVLGELVHTEPHPDELEPVDEALIAVLEGRIG